MWAKSRLSALIQMVWHRRNFIHSVITTIFIHTHQFWGGVINNGKNIIIKIRIALNFWINSLTVSAWSLELVDMIKSWISSNEAFFQAFTAVDLSCCLYLCLGLSAFNLVFSKWKAALLCRDQVTVCQWRISNFFALRNSWVAFAVCFEWVFMAESDQSVYIIYFRLHPDTLISSQVIGKQQWHSSTCSRTLPALCLCQTHDLALDHYGTSWSWFHPSKGSYSRTGFLGVFCQRVKLCDMTTIEYHVF